LLIAAWLTLSPLLLSLNPARSDVPYFGILRGWENLDVNQIVGYDIAADESGIYIAGEFFKAPGYGPTVLFLNPDHTFRCQKVLQFRVDTSRGIPRSGAYSIALNNTHVIVAGVYGEWPGPWHVARLFIAVFDKEDCTLTGIKELIDMSLLENDKNEWVNLYPFFVSGVKVVWDQARSSMFVMLQTLETNTFVPHLYIIQLDTGLDILNAVRYDLVKDGSGNFYVSDIFDGGSILYVTGAYINEYGESHILYGEISKDDFIAFWYYFPLSFPGYDVRVEGFLPLSRIVLTFGDVGGWTYVNIAFTMACSGRDCNEGFSVFRLGILRFPLGIKNPPVEVRLYDFTTTHWNTPAPYNHYNNTWVTRVAEAGGVLYIVGFLNMDPNWLIYDEKSRSYSLAEDLDGFVYAVDAGTLNPQYMFRVVSLDGAPSSGGSRVPSAVLGAGSYNGYAYITGTAGNYYLEFTPFNPSNITGTATRNYFTLEPVRPRLTTELRNFEWAYDNVPLFDQDVHPSTAGFYGVLRLKQATTTTSTTTSIVTETTTSTRTVTSTPTTTVTRFTTSTRTAVTTEYVSSTVYTTRIAEGTVTRVETVTSVTTIPVVTTLTGTTTVRSVVTATTTPTVYAAAQTTVYRNQTVQLTTTEIIQPEGMVPWPYLLLPFMPLLLFPPLVLTGRRRLTITILEGAAAQPPKAQPANILSEYFKPGVGRIKRGGKVTFRNKDKEMHEVELYAPGMPGRQRIFTLKPGEKVGIKISDPGRYFFRLTRNPDKLGILEVE
jgi:hypothetical protein